MNINRSKKVSLIKANEKWLQDHTFKFENESEVDTKNGLLSTFIGYPVHIDNSVETYEIVYED